MTDIEIAHKCALKNISEIAAAAGIGEAYVEPYGRHKAKISLDLLREKAAAEVESRGLSVRQTETLVASLLRQAEHLGQQIALAGVDRHPLGPCFPQAVAVGAGDIGSEIMAVVLDNAHFQPPAAQGRQKLFQQRRLAAVVQAADGQHRRALEFDLLGQSLFLFTVQN